jgi:hypothetical protein
MAVRALNADSAIISTMSDLAASPAQLPELPEAIEASVLQTLSEADLEALASRLQAALRAVTDAMAPYEAQLREIRSRQAELSTERRRRERAAQVQQRASVRQQAKSGEMPTVIDALSDADDLFSPSTPFREIHAFLATGGEVGFGFATRPGTVTFTDGRQQRQATSWGEARELHRLGWDPGTPGIPGVRVHLIGTRVERVVAATEVVVQPA